VLAAAVLAVPALLGAPVTAGADDLFEITTVPNVGRAVAAELADFDGDGRLDLFVGVLSGIPPDEERLARVYLQTPDGRIPTTPTHVRVLPEWSAVYDVEDVRPDQPGSELVVLVPDGVEILSLAGPDAPTWKHTVPGATTVGPSGDERGLEPYRIVHRHLGEEPWLLVPQIGRLTALTGDGEVKASMATPRRANYFIVPPTGLVSLESHLQVFLDAPKLLLGDIDGDGRNDIATATRHEIWIYLQRDEGGFAEEPDRRIPFGMVTPRDHIRGSGGVSPDAGDIDGDGRLDLIVSHVAGGFTDATTTVYVYLNKGGPAGEGAAEADFWRIDEPDETLVHTGSVESNALIDLNRDGAVELLRLAVTFSLFEVVELLVSREVDIELGLYRHRSGRGFGAEPWTGRKVSLPISFDTFRTKGFVPTLRGDLNGDGYPDFTASGGGDELQFFAGGPEGPFRHGSASQRMSTAGVIGFGDWTGDGLTDIVLFDPHNYDVPVRLGRNLGRLPGTPPGIAKPAR